MTMSGYKNILGFLPYGPGPTLTLEFLQVPVYNIDMDSMTHTQTQAIGALEAHIPLNEFNLPTGLYRVDLLPFHDYETNQYNQHEQQQESGVLSTAVVERGNDQRVAGFRAQDLDIAFVPLHYDEGYPVMPDGAPFWDRLPHETPEAHYVFELYRQMGRGPNDSERENGLHDLEDYQTSATGFRSVSALAQSLHEQQPTKDISTLHEVCHTYSILYYWKYRSRAYDLFKVAHFRKQQELRAIETHNDHYIITRKLLGRLLRYFDNEEDFWDMLTPKVGIDMFKTLTQTQRISAGVPAAGPSRESEEQHSSSLEVIMRRIAVGNTAEVISEESTETQLLLDQAMSDPETVKEFQELVIKLSQGNG